MRLLSAIIKKQQIRFIKNVMVINFKILTYNLIYALYQMILNLMPIH